MKRLFILLFVAAVMVSCKVTFVPTKSQTALDMIQQIQQDANSAFYTANYDEAAYSKASDDIDSLISFDKSRVKSGDILKQDNWIKSMFDEIRVEHKAKGSIVQSEQDTYKAYFNSVVEPRIFSENSLK